MMIQKAMITMSCYLLYTLLLLTPATLSLNTRSDKADLEAKLEARFEELVELNEIILTHEEKDYRLSLFTVNCLAQSPGNMKKIGNRRQKKLCPGISIDSIYTAGELDQMNGAMMESSPPPEVQPEEEDNIRHRRETEWTPSSYDVRDDVEVSKPIHQKTCGNCYIHTFVSALEIAYTRQTGEFVPFSRQELTDCYYSGCSGGDYRVVSTIIQITLLYDEKFETVGHF
jgi:C1A family cysteine protease